MKNLYILLICSTFFFITSCTSLVRFTSEPEPVVKSDSTQAAANTDDKFKDDDLTGVEFSGVATFYHNKFQGKKTASGEMYDKDDYTAAHRTLPFGTKIVVTNKSTKKSVVVRINDRGPFVRGRIIDLSKAAADEIGLTNMGIAEVEIKVLK